jgi:DNA-binding PadR family transcriptional regulator
LARLERRGLIEAVASEDRRRPYRLTDTGREVLRAQLDRLAGFVATARARMAAPR